MDDILIYSEKRSKHEGHIKMVLDRLRDAGLQVDIRKCEFFVTRTKFLGFIVTTEGIEIDPEKIAAVVNWREPTKIRAI